MESPTYAAVAAAAPSLMELTAADRVPAPRAGVVGAASAACSGPDAASSQHAATSVCAGLGGEARTWLDGVHAWGESAPPYSRQGGLAACEPSAPPPPVALLPMVGGTALLAADHAVLYSTSDTDRGHRPPTPADAGALRQPGRVALDVTTSVSAVPSRPYPLQTGAAGAAQCVAAGPPPPRLVADGTQATATVRSVAGPGPAPATVACVESVAVTCDQEALAVRRDLPARNPAESAAAPPVSGAVGGTASVGVGGEERAGSSSDSEDAAAAARHDPAHLQVIGAVLAAGDGLLFRCALCPHLCGTVSRMRTHFRKHERRGDAPAAAAAAAADTGGSPAADQPAVRRLRSGRAPGASTRCDVCHTVLSSVAKLQVHRRTHTGERPFACAYCPKRSADHGNLRKHEQLHFKRRPFGCDRCRLTFWSAGRQRAHTCKADARTGRLRPRPARRTDSGASEEQTDEPADEPAEELTEEPIEEPTEERTNEPTEDPAEGPAEERTEGPTGEASVPLVVDECGRAGGWAGEPSERCADAGSTGDDESAEVAPLGGRQSGTVDCRHCGRRLLSLASWQRHQRAVHSAERPFQCRYCDKTGNDKGNMRKHEAGHFKPRPYCCTTCGITFFSSWRLHQHQCKLKGPEPDAADEPAVTAADNPLPARLVRGHKSAGDPTVPSRKRRDHVCPVCGKAMLSYASLEMHYRTHTGEKPFQCTECGKRFSIQGNLAVHQRIHTGERPFQCEECGRMFMYQSHLKIHSRTHSGARPYLCRFCQKGFASSSSRRVHEETVHSDERKFICEKCGAGFKEKKHLKRHRWKKHQEADQEVAL